MKTFGYLLMAVMACMTCSCRDEEPLPDPVPPVVEPENPGNPEEPDTGKVYLGIAPIIENMQEQRAVVENWKEGHCLGVTAAGDVNIPFTFDGRRWKAGKQVEVTADQKVSAYYPYNVQYTDMTAIPVDITTQEDYMYGEGGVSVEKPSAALVMKHALSLVRILIKKNDYTGDGMVDAVTFGGVRLSASMDVTSGKLLPAGQRMPHRNDGAQFILHKRPGTDIRMLGLVFNQADVYGIVQDLSFYERGTVDDCFYRKLRIHFLIPFQKNRKNVRADGDAGSQTQGTQRIPVFDFCLHFIEQGDDVERVPVKFSCPFCGGNPAPYPLKQTNAIVFFQFLDRKAYRGLRQMQLLCRPGNIAVSKNSRKYFHMSECHFYPPYRCSSLMFVDVLHCRFLFITNLLSL